MYDREPVTPRLGDLPGEDWGKAVECVHCGRFYDLYSVVRIARYPDRDTFWTPCCDRQARTGGGDFRERIDKRSEADVAFDGSQEAR